MCSADAHLPSCITDEKTYVRRQDPTTHKSLTHSAFSVWGGSLITAGNAKGEKSCGILPMRSASLDKTQNLFYQMERWRLSLPKVSPQRAPKVSLGKQTADFDMPTVGQRFVLKTCLGPRTSPFPEIPRGSALSCSTSLSKGTACLLALRCW